MTNNTKSAADQPEAVKRAFMEEGSAMPDHVAALTAAPKCLTCNDHGAVGNILTAEPCPDCTAAQPEALAHELFAAAQLAPGEGIEDAVRRIAAALTAATAQPAAPQGVAYADLDDAFESWLEDQDVDRLSDGYESWLDSVRSCWDAALRASNGQAPAAGAVAGPDVKYALAHADTAADLLMRAHEQAPETWRGWYDDALVHIDIARKALAAAPTPAAQADSAQDEPLQAFDSPRAKALMRAWEEGWAACRDAEYVGEEAQNDAFNSSHTLTLCIADDQQLPAPQADSVLEDAARLDWLDQNIFYREMSQWDKTLGGWESHNMWVMFAPKGAQGSARNILDAARKQGGTHD